jgi:multiple sugar transport system ATP-binding protein
MATVAFEQVRKSFDDVVALDDLDLEAGDDDLLVLLGPSGCGKSTALRILAGLEEPTGGRITIGGRSVVGVEPKARDVSMVFQSYALYPHKTVLDNIAFPLKARGVGKEERNRQAAEAAATLGLETMLDRRPGQLSGGQRQRVALARAIVRHPQVFLMDEPLSNLDAKMRTQTRAELVELHRRLHTTFVYVTHDQVEAMTMGTRVAVLDQGRLQQVGPPQVVYDRPANLFVARFIGSPPMNTMAGRVVDHEEQRAVAVAGGWLPLSPPMAAGLEAWDGGPRVVVGVRPEHLSLVAEGIPAEVRVVESLGHERHVACAVGDDLVISRVDPEAPVPEEGRLVHLAAEPRHLHLFDPESGERIEEVAP